jgi:hypothetical protein
MVRVFSLNVFFLGVIVIHRKLKEHAHWPLLLLMFKEEQGVVAT